MRIEQIGYSTLYLCDCMDLMAVLPDKSIDLAIVDPPYGIGVSKKISGTGQCKRVNGKIKVIKPMETGKSEKWDSEPPPQNYFDELFRVSKYQIIWGGNYFMDKIQKPSKCWIGFIKAFISDSMSHSNIEFAYTNLDGVSKYFRQSLNIGGCGSVPTQEERIHPCQKPIKLYKWLLSKYAKQGDKILDTHFGSGSIAIACYDMGFSLVASEIDEDYYNAAVNRLKHFAAQGTLDFSEAV